MDEDGTGQHIKKLLGKLRRGVDEDISQWLWTHVRELAAYQEGNPEPWRTAIQQQSGLAREGDGSKDLNTLLGEMFAQRVAGLIDSLEYLVDEEDGIPAFLDLVRPWLSASVLHDPTTAQELLPPTCDVSSWNLGLGYGTTKGVQALFDDPECAAGYLTLLKMRANSPSLKSKLNLNAARLIQGEHEMGWSKAELQMETSSSHGLVEAAMLVGYGEPLKRLLNSSDGVGLIQRVLADRIGPRCLAEMGGRTGWRTLAEHIIAQADDWADWRDGRGNTISHWLAFAYNKIDGKTAWTAHQALARAFPQHMSQSNDCGHEPTSWMPKLHSDRIAEQILRRAGRTSAAERTQMAPKKHRTI
jgi:hypothetical protein